MEPIKETLNFRADVLSVEERFDREYVDGYGESAVFKNVSLGWYVNLAGSYEALYAGTTKPNTNKGDLAIIRISFYAKPEQTPV